MSVSADGEQELADAVRELDWRALGRLSSTQTCAGYAEVVDGWLATELPDHIRALCGILSGILSLRPARHEEPEEPFLPVSVYRALDRVVLAELAAAAADIPLVDVRTRIIDLAWQRRACAADLVVAACADYALAAHYLFEPDDWLPSEVRLTRAVRLAMSLGRIPFKQATEAVELLIGRVFRSSNPYIAHAFIRLLLESDAGDWSQLDEYCERIGELARLAYTANALELLSYDLEQRYLALQIELRRRLKRADAARVKRIELAEALVRHSEGVRAARLPGAASIAAHHLRAAIKQHRIAGGQEPRMRELMLAVERLQREASMGRITVRTHADLGDRPFRAREAVAGKPPSTALLTLTHGLHEPPTLDELRAMSRDILKSAPFRAFIPALYTGPRGNTVAAHGGVGKDEASRGFQMELKRLTYEYQCMVAQGVLAPAAHQIAAEHGPAIADMMEFLRCGSFVPEERLYTYARGVTAGLYSDFDTAAALLFPQLEHCVRELFFRHGQVTRTLPDTGADNEWDLNRLLVHPAAAAIFGEHVAWDLRVLLVEKAGGNLRNKLAHGLIDDGWETAGKIYLWWACLRMSVTPTEPLDAAVPDS